MTDTLWPGGPSFIDKSGVFKLGTDSVLLAHFASISGIKRCNTAADLGCGSGIISIILAWNHPKLHIDGVEIKQEAAELAIENVRLCSMSDRINIIYGDIIRHRDILKSGTYDFTISNPPYYPTKSGKVAKNSGIAAARSEEFCTIEDVCTAAGYCTRWGGSFFLVHKPERLADIFRSLNNSGFEPKKLRFVHHKANLPPNLVLIESRRGGKPSLTVQSPLILTNDDGSDTEEVKEIYHRT